MSYTSIGGLRESLVSYNSSSPRYITIISPPLLNLESFDWGISIEKYGSFNSRLKKFRAISKCLEESFSHICRVLKELSPSSGRIDLCLQLEDIHGFIIDISYFLGLLFSSPIFLLLSPFFLLVFSTPSPPRVVVSHIVLEIWRNHKEMFRKKFPIFLKRVTSQISTPMPLPHFIQWVWGVYEAIFPYIGPFLQNLWSALNMVAIMSLFLLYIDLISIYI